jgi:hypothetical protein
MTPETTEQLLTVNQAAELVQVSATRVISILANQPSTITFGTSVVSRKARKFRQLRITTSVLLNQVIARRMVR